MVDLILNKKDKVKCPSSWDELTLNQFQELMKVLRPDNDPDPAKIFSVLLGLSFDEIDEKNKRGIEAVTLSIIEWVFEDQMNWDKEPPEYLTIGGHRCKAVSDLEVEAFGKKATAQAIISQSGVKLWTDCIADIVSIYYMEQIFGEYKFTRLEEMKKIVLHMKAGDAYRWTSFFLPNWKRQISVGKNVSNMMTLTRSQLKGRGRLGLKSLKNLVRSGL